jgi:flagellar FliL protein
MKIVIMAAIGLLLLGGTGAAAYYYFMNPAVASTGEVKEASEKEHADKGDGHDKEKAVYVNLEPLILPIVNSEGVTQVVNLVVAVEIASEKDKEKVESLLPRLQDAFIQQMYGELNDKGYMKAGVLQVSKLKQHLNIIATKVLGEDIVSDVLLQVVQQRPA